MAYMLSASGSKWRALLVWGGKEGGSGSREGRVGLGRPFWNSGRSGRPGGQGGRRLGVGEERSLRGAAGPPQTLALPPSPAPPRGWEPPSRWAPHSAFPQGCAGTPGHHGGGAGLPVAPVWLRGKRSSPQKGATLLRGCRAHLPGASFPGPDLPSAARTGRCPFQSHRRPFLSSTFLRVPCHKPRGQAPSGGLHNQLPLILTAPSFGKAVPGPSGWGGG